MRRQHWLLRRPAVHWLRHRRARVVDVAAQVAELVVRACCSMQHLLRRRSIPSVDSGREECVLLHSLQPGVPVDRRIVLSDGLLLTKQRVELLRRRQAGRLRHRDARRWRRLDDALLQARCTAVAGVTAQLGVVRGCIGVRRSGSHAVAAQPCYGDRHERKDEKDDHDEGDVRRSRERSEVAF